MRGSRTAIAPGSPSHAESSSATRSPISASRATHTTRSPVAGAASVAARKDLAPWGTCVRPAWRPRDGTAPGSPRRSRSAAKAPLDASSGGSVERSGTRRPAPREPERSAVVGLARTALAVRRSAAPSRPRCWRDRPSSTGGRVASSTSASADARSRSTSASGAVLADRRSAHSRATFSARRRSRSVLPRPRPLTRRLRGRAPSASRSSCGGRRPCRAVRRPRRPAVPLRPRTSPGARRR